MVILVTLYTLCTIFIYMFFRSVYKLIKVLPSSRSYKRVHRISEINKEKKDVLDYLSKVVMLFLDKIMKLLVKFQFISSQYENEKLNHSLKRVGSGETPERFRARQISYPVMYLLGGWIVSLILNAMPASNASSILGYIVWSTTILVAFLSIYSPQKDLDDKIDEHNIKALREIPRFIRTYRFSPENMDFIKIVKEYLTNGESFLRYDFEQIVSSVNTGVSVDYALDVFAKNINIPVITELTIVLKSSLKNKVENATNLELIERKIIQIDEDNHERELEKRIPILQAINDVLIYALIAVFAVPMLLYTIKSFSLITQ